MLFFELLQVALGNRERLSCTPTPEEWSDLYDESERQAVTGILLHGIDRLPLEQWPLRVFLLQWIGVGQLIEQQNRLLDARCEELLGRLKDAGLHGTILKGQGIARFYDKELQALRQSGDIDVYIAGGLKNALSMVQGFKSLRVEGWDYKHAHLRIWDDTEVEMHYRVEVLLNLRKNRRLQRWFRENDALLFSEKTGLTTPSTLFNVFYILLHIYRHFLYEGVGLRQIVDYYFVLKAINKEKLDVSLFLDAVSQFGMERFAKGLMWVIQEALGMPKEWMLWEPDGKEGIYILEEVMAGGNFGHHDEKIKHNSGRSRAVKAVCKHNWHLLSHYPADVIWAPVWFVWHKCWKLKTKALMAIKKS